VGLVLPDPLVQSEGRLKRAKWEEVRLGSKRVLREGEQRWPREERRYGSCPSQRRIGSQLCCVLGQRTPEWKEGVSEDGQAEVQGVILCL